MSEGTDRPLVLVIDEVPAVVRFIELDLGFQGMRTAHELIENDPVAKAVELQPDAIVIGALLPTPDVYDALVRLWERVSVPILFINGSAMEADAATALEMGAADVISRPFSPEDIGLRLNSMLNHDLPETTTLRRGPLVIDTLRRGVTLGDRKLALGTNEWSLVLALAQAEGYVDPETLLRTVWGDRYAQANRFLESWIRRLRVNVGDDPRTPNVVLGNLSIGYRLAD